MVLQNVNSLLTGAESRVTLKEYFESLLTVPDFKIFLNSKTIIKHAERFLSDTDQSVKCHVITKGCKDNFISDCG